LLAVGICGDYVARIYDELKDRPLYVVDALHNISPERLAALPDRVAVHPSALDLVDAKCQTAAASSLSAFRPAA
jgi:hypothetical protein